MNLRIPVFILVFLGMPLQLLAWQTPGKVSLLLASEDISCNGYDDGRIRLTLLSGQVPVNYQWANPAQGLSGNGQFASNFSEDTLLNLPPGNYQFTLTDAMGTDTVLTAEVFEPPVLTGSIQILSSYNGYHVACSDASDGSIRATLQGGTPPYFYSWSSGESEALSLAHSAGPGFLFAEDAQGCPLQFDFDLTAPPPLEFVLEIEGEKCFGENTGLISMESIGGGVPPYEYFLNGLPTNGQTFWDDQAPGIYTLELRDANLCRLAQAAVLPTGLEFEFNIEMDLEYYSGDTIALSIEANRPVDTLFVKATEGFHFNQDTLYVYTNFSGEYAVTPVDLDGCRTEDVLNINVKRRRSVYAPNVISPDADIPENSWFTLYDGGGVERIELLQVFNHLGSKVFEAREIQAGQPTSGWNGQVDNQLPLPGVFLWYAELRYSDGRVEKYKGDVLLIR